MNRLTKKKGNYFNDYCLDFRQCLNKLVQLEDIEEELGIDLITLFKALKNGVYIRNYEFTTNKIIKIEKIKYWNIRLNDKEFDFRRSELGCYTDYATGGLLFPFSDYGKTWSLTREELEDGN